MTEGITMKDTINDGRKDVALFRFAMISEALHLPPEEVAPYLKRQAQREVTIPGSGRRKVAATTMRSWIRAYRKAGFDGLMPKRRKDRGLLRHMPGDVVETLLAIRRENMDLSVRQVIARARATDAVPDDVIVAPSTLHRLFTREGLMKRRADAPSGDLRRFATEAAGQLWQSDVMHGPKVRDTRGRKRKTYLIALLDDATRVVPYAHFALGETAADYLVVLKEAILRRGLPERLFCDNGANFRSRQLMMICGRMGISLLHARPYHPAGRGKIERWFRTVRGQFLAPLDPQDIPDLETLNQRFRTWVEAEYHMTPHRGLEGQRTPLDQWALTCGRVRRPDPGVDLDDMFLFEATRRVSRARTVSLDARIYEVEAGMNGAKVTLRYDPSAPPDRPIKVVHEGKPRGFARLLDLYANARIKRPAGQPTVTFRALVRNRKKED